MSIYFWYPKMFGRMMNEKLGVIHFILTFTFMNLVFFPMHMVGIHAMPRRVNDYTQYEMFAKFVPINRFMSYSAFMLGLSQILVIVNFVGSWFWGKPAPQNPWKCNSLEWTAAPTPPPHGNFPVTPVVYHGPYEYNSPLTEEDWLPQNKYVEGADRAAAMAH
jgi:cytochrome c oxidase subunit 1